MAKSKSGGTRSYIRGKIGADVYSIGKDGKGSRQQVVRSLAEQVSNPQTEAQMRGRMVMSTIMQAVSALSPIIDHSFDGVVNGQPSISEFIRRNYQLVKADAAAHPSTGNSFGLVKYQQKGAKAGLYVIAKGEALVPTAVTANATGLAIAKTGNDDTVGEIKTILGAAAGDYLTFVAIDGNGNGQFLRAIISDELADSTQLTSANIASLFKFEGTLTPSVTLDTLAITIGVTVPATAKSYGLIVSKKETTGWKHNDAVMVLNGANPDFAADTAFATYPVGSARFLNGGDL